MIGDIFNYDAAGAAAKKAQEGYQNAMGGVLDASQQSQENLGGAAASAKGQVNEDTQIGNSLLNDTLGRETANLDPYLKAGSQGVTGLADLAKNGFKFNYDDYKNDPAYQFQMQAGTDAINNSASARGLLQSGNTLKGLAQYGQGLASTYYNEAFDRALKTFGTNADVNRSLAGVGLTSTNLYQGAQENAGNQVAKNTVNQGYYGGNVDIQTALEQAKIANSAAKEAGDYAVGKGNVAGAGAMAKGKALGNLFDDAAEGAVMAFA